MDDDRNTPLGVWVYGVAPGDRGDLPQCPGVDGRHEARLIRAAGLAAIVSDVPLAEFGEGALRESLEHLDWLEAVARGHERVLDRALRGGAVVPFRICTIYETADRVRVMLAAAQRDLGATLARLRGRTEWGVKAYRVRRRSPAQSGAGTPSSGMAYLAGKRQARVAEDAARRASEATVEAIHLDLSAHAVDAVVSPPQDRRLSGHDGEMVLNAAYLVADDELSGFESLFGALANRYAPGGLRLELTGPWPAYHFAGAPEPRDERTP